MYSHVSLFIDGAWTKAATGRSLPVVNPATGDDIGTVAHAERVDLDRALEAAEKGFRAWRKVSAFDRSKLMRKAAQLLRERADRVAPLMTLANRGAEERAHHERGTVRPGRRDRAVPVFRRGRGRG